MSNISIDSWNDFMFKVGEDFYTFIHGEDENNTEYTKVTYPYTYQGKVYGLIPVFTNSSYQTISLPYLADLQLVQGETPILLNAEVIKSSNLNLSWMGSYPNDVREFELSLDCLNSFNSEIYYIGSDSYLYKKDASDVLHDNAFSYHYKTTAIRNNTEQIFADVDQNGIKIKMPSVGGLVYQNYNGYDYYFSRRPSGSPTSSNNNYQLYNSGFTDMYAVSNQPVLIDSSNTDTTYITNVRTNIIDSSDTIETYTYYIDNSSDYITVNYSVDGNNDPTGYIDINPSGNISFDDLFDMFNTILAPLVGVGLDLPDWNDYSPEYPIVTGGDINIYLPDVTGEYPPVTIKPIESEVNYIISDGFPELPSITMDVDSSVGAVNAGFTFLDGCGLLMPFVTLAVIRLLISKFRGDS